VEEEVGLKCRSKCSGRGGGRPPTGRRRDRGRRRGRLAAWFGLWMSYLSCNMSCYFGWTCHIVFIRLVMLSWLENCLFYWTMVVLNSNAYVILSTLWGLLLSYLMLYIVVVYCWFFWLKTDKMLSCQKFDKILKFNKCMANLVKCCQNRTKFAMVIKNKTDFIKGMNVFLHVI
jgi:hypothetical protein